MAKVELTLAKLAELKQKAEAAADSPWIADGLEVVRLRHSDFDDPTDEVYQVASCEWIRNAEHIAAADPATVLAMVEEIEQLRRMEQKWGQMLRNVKDTAPDLETFLSPDAFKINESEAGQ